MFDIPAWVFVLFILVSYLGFKRCYDSVIKIDRLALMPIIFTLFSINTVNSLFGINPSSGILLLSGTSIGILLGYYQVKSRVIRADKKNRLIKIPGDISMLILVLVIFFVELYIHYAVDAHWIIADSNIFKFVSILVFGIIMGITMGRNICYFYKYQVQSEQS